MATIEIKRVYEPPEPSDGFRILVDRLWPRGLKKEAAHIDLWMKEIAPSTDLRRWFNHDPEKWKEFKKKFEAELKKGEAIQELIGQIKQHKKVTLLYAAHDEQHNQAVVLQLYLQKQLK